MKREEALQLLEKCAANDDTEAAHADADDVLCELLDTLGFNDIVQAYKKVSKWYA